MVDSERGIGRPDRALELGRSVDRENLPLEAKVGLAIAMSGARLDQDDPRGALDELERAPIDLTRVHPWSPELFLAFAAVHEDLGQAEEAERWNRRAARAAALLDEVDEESTSVEVVDEVSRPRSRGGRGPDAADGPRTRLREPEPGEPAAEAEPGEQDR